MENPNPGDDALIDGCMENRKVVLVTGASSGIGKSIAQILSQKGYLVFGTSRKPKANGSEGFEMLQLDVNSENSAKSCVSNIIKKTGRIDVLINNAGYVVSGAQEEVSLEETIAQFDTNFFGVLRMVKAVLPYMRKQKAGRIINIGSIAGTIPVPFQGTYAATKAALLAYSQALRQEVKEFHIHISLVQPGFISTEIMHNAQSNKNTISAYTKSRNRTISKLQDEIKNGADVKIVADVVLKIVESQNPHFRYPVGKESIYLHVKRLVPDPIFESAERNHWNLDS